jgi:hypothetical protein
MSHTVPWGQWAGPWDRLHESWAWSDFDHSKGKQTYMEVALSGVHTNMYPIVAPLQIKGVEFVLHWLFTDGVAGFATNHSIDCNIGFRMRGLASVFTVKLAAIRLFMDHIENEFHVSAGTCWNCGEWKGWFWGETGYFGQYGVQCTIGCSRLTPNRETENNGRKVGKSLKQDSIFPRVSLRPWFEEWRTERKFITTVSRIISGHCGVRAHLIRFSIVDGSMCVSRGSWACRPYNMEMLSFFDSNPASEVITVWHLRGDPAARLVCAIEL